MQDGKTPNPFLGWSTGQGQQGICQDHPETDVASSVQSPQTAPLATKASGSLWHTLESHQSKTLGPPRFIHTAEPPRGSPLASALWTWLRPLRAPMQTSSSEAVGEACPRACCPWLLSTWPSTPVPFCAAPGAPMTISGRALHPHCGLWTSALCVCSCL